MTHIINPFRFEVGDSVADGFNLTDCFSGSSVYVVNGLPTGSAGVGDVVVYISTSSGARSCGTVTSTGSGTNAGSYALHVGTDCGDCKMDAGPSEFAWQVVDCANGSRVETAGKGTGSPAIGDTITYTLSGSTKCGTIYGKTFARNAPATSGAKIANCDASTCGGGGTSGSNAGYLIGSCGSSSFGSYFIESSGSYSAGDIVEFTNGGSTDCGTIIKAANGLNSGSSIDNDGFTDCGDCDSSAPTDKAEVKNCFDPDETVILSNPNAAAQGDVISWTDAATGWTKCGTIEDDMATGAPVAEDDGSGPYTDCDECLSTNSLTGPDQHYVFHPCGADFFASVADRDDVAPSVGDVVTVSQPNCGYSQMCGTIIADDGIYDDGMDSSSCWYTNITDTWTDCPDCETNGP